MLFRIGRLYGQVENITPNMVQSFPMKLMTSSTKKPAWNVKETETKPLFMEVQKLEMLKDYCFRILNSKEKKLHKRLIMIMKSPPSYHGCGNNEK